LQTPAKLETALADVGSAGGVVFHALVAPEAKRSVEQFCADRRLPVCDLTGSFVEFLTRATGLSPTNNIRALHEVSEGYRARIAALEFTLAHDDGLGLETIHQADIVLVGVSRTSKTPTSIYLGQQGYATANFALAIEAPVPDEVLALPATKVVGLLIDPLRLAEVRHSRRESWSMQQSSYTDMTHIAEEIAWSRKLFGRKGWRTIDVTHSAIEETAGRIVEMLGLMR
jgi:[pyruvate, water dikinase]-phosphate phosphotransferase / [pyruvate, water dikinase] kinase